MMSSADNEQKIILSNGKDPQSILARFLRIIPTTEATTMNGNVFRSAVRRMVGQHHFGDDIICTLCKNNNGNRAGHLYTCPKICKIPRHDDVLHRLYHALRKIGPAVKEHKTYAGINGEAKHDRRVDIQADIDDKREVHFIDVSFTSEMSEACIKAAQRNMAKPHTFTMDQRYKEKLRKYAEDAKRKSEMYDRKFVVKPIVLSSGGAIQAESFKTLTEYAKIAKSKYNDPRWLGDLLDSLSFGFHRKTYCMEQDGLYQRKERALRDFR